MCFLSNSDSFQSYKKGFKKAGLSIRKRKQLKRIKQFEFMYRGETQVENPKKLFKSSNAQLVNQLTPQLEFQFIKICSQLINSL